MKAMVIIDCVGDVFDYGNDHDDDGAETSTATTCTFKLKIMPTQNMHASSQAENVHIDSKNHG